MNKKYIDFYKKFILQTKTVSNSGVVSNRELVTFLGFLILPQPYRQSPFHHLMLL